MLPFDFAFVVVVVLVVIAVYFAVNTAVRAAVFVQAPQATGKSSFSYDEVDKIA